MSTSLLNDVGLSVVIASNGRGQGRRLEICTEGIQRLDAPAACDLARAILAELAPPLVYGPVSVDNELRRLAYAVGSLASLIDAAKDIDRCPVVSRLMDQARATSPEPQWEEQ